MTVYESISAATKIPVAQISIVKSIIAKNTTNSELAFFLMSASAVGLNPILKEIWCYKDLKGNLIIFAGRDGFLKKAQENNRWNGMQSAHVCENDEFSMELFSYKVTHNLVKDRGPVVGAWAYTKPKGVETPTLVYINRSDYDRKRNVWNTHPGPMCVKVAETLCLKKAYGISGIQAEYDFDVKDDVAIPIPQEDHPKVVTEETVYEKPAEEKKEGLRTAREYMLDTIGNMCNEMEINIVEFISSNYNKTIPDMSDKELSGMIDHLQSIKENNDEGKKESNV